MSIKEKIDLATDEVFHLRLRQALVAAQHSIRQVGILLIAFETANRTFIDTSNLLVEFLESIITRLRSVVRDSDTVVHVDSGQMAVLLPSVAGPDDVILVAKKILTVLEKPLHVNGIEIEANPRIGIALYPEHSTSTNVLLQRAALALTSAQQTRNPWLVYSEEQPYNQRNPLGMSELREAIVADQLFLLYQPKVNLINESISGVEVLARWQHPDIGLISPDEFIPVAERSGLIIPLTLWVLHQALIQCRTWNTMGIDVSVAVNLSMWNLEAQELPEQIKGLLKSLAVAPERLELEITESAIMGDPQRAMRTLRLIRDLGVALTIDDFGTGYSSLAYLRKLPVLNIKIDKSFVINMEHDRDNAVIVRSIIDLGHNLGLKVIAEGVETFESSEMLRAFNCDEAQGYFYSRPIPAYAITKILAERTTTVSRHIEPLEDTSDFSAQGTDGINASSLKH
jgi:diguanylate cyclase